MCSGMRCTCERFTAAKPGTIASTQHITVILLKAGLIVAVMHMLWERLALVYAILVPPLLSGSGEGTALVLGWDPGAG